MVADEMAEAARKYQRIHGWSVTARGWAVWMTAGQVEGIDAPRRIAEPALAKLRERDRHGPVVAVPGVQERWVFLVEPNTLANFALLACLAELGAHCLRGPNRIDLPPTQVFGDVLSWIVRPTRPLADFTTVVRALINAPT
jgi:hypothetical protein